LMGIVAFSLVLHTRPFLWNEKTIAEADCILGHGPTVKGGPHPFELCGATRRGRGVWFWPAAETAGR